jgi:hypothetical protein
MVIFYVSNLILVTYSVTKYAWHLEHSQNAAGLADANQEKDSHSSVINASVNIGAAGILFLSCYCFSSLLLF